jgi:UDP-3-O-[3-hydroxymyristoyl] glucosamine N-acyltransferase
MNLSLFEIAELLDGEAFGDKNFRISALSPIDNILPGTLVFAEGKDNIKLAEASEAGAMLVNKSITSDKKNVIQVAHPFKAFITLLQHFYPPQKNTATIHTSAVIAGDVKLGNNISIGPYVVIESGANIGDDCVLKSHVHIGHNVTIGNQTTLHPHVTIYDNCRLGSGIIIHASTVIGSDGFGYHYMDGEHCKIPHVGYVQIDDNVEIGANTVVDRATIGATKIGRGTKIDNLVQVAHSVKLGKHNIVCAFTGIAGSSQSGDHVIFAANVGVSDHVRIDDGVILAARTGVPPKKHLRAGNVYLGNPARPKDKAIELELSVTRIPFMRKHLRALTDKVAELSQRLDDKEAK